MPAVRNPRVYTRARASTRFISPSSSQTDPTSSPPGTPSKRALADLDSSINSPSKRRRAFTLTSKTSHNKTSLSKAVAKPPQKQSTLVQLHLLPDKPTLRECKLCGLSYTHAAAEDERVHRAHCLRVRKGMEWGREEERALGLDELEEVAKGVRLKHGKSGRIVCFRADLEGKMGRKVWPVHPSSGSPMLTGHLSSLSSWRLSTLHFLRPLSHQLPLRRRKHTFSSFPRHHQVTPVNQLPALS
jgi:hypothetical protein